MEEKSKGKKRKTQREDERVNTQILAYYVFSIKRESTIISPKLLTECYPLTMLFLVNSHTNEVLPNSEREKKVSNKTFSFNQSIFYANNVCDE